MASKEDEGADRGQSTPPAEPAGKRPPRWPPRPSSTPSPDEHPSATMESTRLCHLQECRSDLPVARELVTASLQLRVTCSDDADDVAIDGVDDRIGLAGRQRIISAHGEQELATDARPLVPLGYGITVGSPGGSDQRFLILVDGRAPHSACTPVEKKVILRRFTVWNACHTR